MFIVFIHALIENEGEKNESITIKNSNKPICINPNVNKDIFE